MFTRLTHPRSIKAAAEFETRLAEVSKGMIILFPPDQEFLGSGSSDNKLAIRQEQKLQVKCVVCDHEWSVVAFSLFHSRNGCPACAIQRRRDSWGTLRHRRATEAEKTKAREMRDSGKTYQAIADKLGRSSFTIRLWCDPVVAERNRVSCAAHGAANAEEKRKKDRRYKQQTLHGRVGRAKHGAMRRGVYRQYDEAGNIIYQEFQTYSAEDERLLKQLEHRLRYLNRVKKDGHKWTLEHLLPLSMGGTHQPLNLAIRSQGHNFSKGASLHEGDLKVRERNIVRLLMDDGADSAIAS